MFKRPTFNAILNDDATVKVSAPCVKTQEEYSVILTQEDFAKWRSGIGHIQDQLPNLSIEDREFLISGISPKGWQQIFG